MATGIPERYRPIDTLQSAAAYVDAEGAVLVENDSFRALRSFTGSGAARVGGFMLPTLFIESDRKVVRDVLAGERQGSRPASRTLTPAGATAPMLAEFVPIKRKAGGRIFWQVTLRPSQQPAGPFVELASRAAMTAGIVHDLRAPVQVVIGWASLLRRKHDDPERIEHALTLIERNAELVMNLLDLLLDQTRPLRPRAPLPGRTVDLAELVRAEVRAIQPLAEESGVRVSLTIDAPEIAVQGDEVQLRRVVINILGNAVKFTPRNGVIACRLWRLGGWAGLAVRDNGPGISREFLPRVFDPFVQEPGHRLHSDEGIGLGLAVVRHLVEQHGGTVTASSAGSGRGAAFTVLLPAVPPNATEAPTRRPLQATTCGE